MPDYGCYVKFTARPGERDALVELLLGAASLVESAPGCRIYLINTSQDDPDVVWVTEVWDNESDAQAPLRQEGTQERIQRVLLLLARSPERTIIQPVGGKGLV
jgi:quinol monooxygenase YgiN